MPKLAFKDLNGNVLTPVKKEEQTNTSLETAKLITFQDYNSFHNPQFEGQTSVDKNGNYKMYCSVVHKEIKLFFYTNNTL